MELFMKEVGREISEKVMEFRYGLMVQDIKETGIIIKQMAKESLSTLMEIYMKVIG